MRVFRILLLTVAGLAVGLVLNRGAQAQSTQLTSPSCTGSSCAQIHPLHFDELTAAQVGATQPPLLQSDDVPWIAQTGVAPPLAVKPADTGVAMKTSLGQWRDFNAAMLAKRTEDSKAMTPKELQLPKPPVMVSPLDVWSSLDVQGLARDADETTKAAVGADYKVSRSTTAGVAAERADTRAANGVGIQKNDSLAAHVTYQATPLLSVDAKTLWEAGTAAAGLGAGRTDRSSVVVAPRIKYPIAVGGGQTIEPFVTVSDDFALSAAGPDAAGGKRNTLSAGTGVTLSKPKSYSLSVTADVEGVGAAEPANVKSKLQLSVPLQ